MAVRGLVVQRPGVIELVERAEPVASDGEIVVGPTAVGLCGTDLEIIDGRVDPAFVRYPVTLGHEWTGVTISDGEAVPAGTPVVVEGIIPCRRCERCVAGATNLCVNYDELGFTRDGAASDRIVVRADLVHRLGEVNPEDAALVEPAAVVFRALRRAEPRPGCRALVVGDGTVALLVVHLLGLWSPAEVAVLGLRPEQSDLAKAAGATGFETDRSKAGEAYDLVVEAAGSADGVVTAVAGARRGGTVVQLGLAGHGVTAPIPVDDIVDRDLTILGSFSYTSSAWRDVVDLVNAGRLHPAFAVTHRFALDSWAAAIETLRGTPGPRGKVLLTVSEAQAWRRSR
jgi:threonine dehydrogenase-like Zn-dependent dehydrogenase